jgi:hypothetical protein
MRREGAIFIICSSFKEIRCIKTDVNILLYVLISVEVNLETGTSHRRIKRGLYIIPFKADVTI